MNAFFLRLNASKTKILVIIPSSLRNSIIIQGTFIDGTCIRFDKSAKNLGVVIDNELTFKPHIEKVVQACFVNIRKLSKIRDFLSFEELQTAVSALVFQRMDYCNSLFYGINEELINKLQSVQNSAARLVRGKGMKKCSTENYIRECHWLRVKERITFKLCLLVHKCLHGSAPDCLKEMMVYARSKRTMKLKQVSYSGSYGSRCFARVAPKMWNLLPLNIRCQEDIGEFKKLLKTFLFTDFSKFEKKLKEV